LDDNAMLSSASISLLQHRGVPTKANYNSAASPIADIQDAVAKLKKEEADAEKTLAELQNSKDSMATGNSFSLLQNAAEDKASLPEKMATPPTSPMYTAAAEQLVDRQTYTQQNFPAPLEKASQRFNSAPQLANTPLYGFPQSSLSEPTYELPLQSRISRTSGRPSESLLESGSQEQGSSALMSRLVAAELAQTKALLAIQARQDELEDREAQFEAHALSLDASAANCSTFTKNGCGPVTNDQSCDNCCRTGEGLRSGSFSGGKCSCHVRQGRYRTICTDGSVKMFTSMLSILLILAAHVSF
jgi:hypothetical protein